MGRRITYCLKKSKFEEIECCERKNGETDELELERLRESESVGIKFL